MTYAGSLRVILKPTGVEDKARILSAIDELSSGGRTAMGSGIDLAYEQAMQGAKPGAISREIALSDGDANVGRATHDEIHDDRGSREAGPDALDGSASAWATSTPARSAIVLRNRSASR